MKEKFLKWLKAAGIRAIRTFGQSVASLLTVGAAINELDWGYIASVSVVSAVYSIATSIAGLPELKTEEAKPEENTEEDNIA